jgi:hypothetical protein
MTIRTARIVPMPRAAIAGLQCTSYTETGKNFAASRYGKIQA